MPGFVYLASPYSHPDPEVRLSRFREALRAGAWLLSRRIWYYGPIQHAHIQATQFALPTDAAFWWDYNRTMLDRSSGAIMLCIDGWQQSKGMVQERDHAIVRGLQVQYMAPGGDAGWLLSDSAP